MEPTIEVLSAFLAKLEVLAIVTIVPLHCFALEPMAAALVVPLTSLSSAYSLSSFYLKQLPYHTIAQLSLVVTLTS